MRSSNTISKKECQNVKSTGHQSLGKNTKYYYVQRHLSAIFHNLGHCAGKYPLWFVIVPLAVSGILATGFIHVTMENRLEYLFTPLNARSKMDRASVESLFPRSELQDMGRQTRLSPFVSIIATAKDGGNILRKSILDEINMLDSFIRDITIKRDNQSYFYHDICLRNYNMQCFSNDGLIAHKKINEIHRGIFKMKYPLDKDGLAMSISAYPYNFGGVTMDEEGYVKEVQAFRLIYLLDDFTKEKEKMSIMWMTTFLDKLPQIVFDEIYVCKITKQSLDIETSKITYNVLPLLITAVLIMIAFGAVSCMTSDWISSKPWLGVAACISSLLGSVSAFGILLFCGAEYVDINVATIFLMLGIGMDDSFVILAAWRSTDPKETVEDRMSQTFSESAVSISITSLTNFLASCTGLATPYRVIRIYSLYSAISVLFAYIAQITFFGGCVALSGRRESANRHAAFCFPVKRNSSKGFLSTMLIEGCKNTKHIHVNNTAARSTFATQTFDFLGKMLSKTYVKLVVVLTFFVYFTLGIFCIRNNMVIAFDYTDAFPYFSYAKCFINQQYKYFSEYSYNFQVVINATLDYSELSVQNDIEEILHKFESSPYVHSSSSTESWLREYLYLSNHETNAWFLEKLDMNKSEDFLHGLRNVFLKLVKRFKDDVRFSEDGSKIIASRFILSSGKTYDSVEERKLVNSLWKIADNCKYPVYIYNQYFFLYDLSSSVEMSTVQCLIVTSVLIVIVFIIFIPNLVCAFSVAGTILLIETGLIGFMSIWNVPLNIISMICLVVSAGLCVDYSAHITYAFVSSKETIPNEKLKGALSSVGYPALQGCISTILGIIVLNVAPIESVVVFFKIIFLVMILSFLHAVLFIPVILSLWEELWTFMKTRQTCLKSSKVLLRSRENEASEAVEAIL